jgi:drug/metabolite transporter (DMT)-like permease
MRAGDWGRLLALAGLWSGSFLLIEVALAGLPVPVIVWGRVAGAAGVLAAVLVLAGSGLPRGRKAWAALAVMGLLNNVVPFVLIVAAQTAMTAGLAAVLVATTPFLTLVSARLGQGERAGTLRLAGAALGLAGVAAIAAAAGRVAPAPAWAVAAVALAALSYAQAALWGRRLGPMGVAPLQAAFGQTAASALILAPWAGAAFPWGGPPPGAAPLAAVAALAVLCTALAYALYFRLLSGAGAARLSLVAVLQPALTLAGGAVLLGEGASPLVLPGLALVAAGMVLVDRGGRA